MSSSAETASPGQPMPPNPPLRVALVAHDRCKSTLVDWARRQRALLEEARLVGTGSTATQVQQATGLPVQALLGGPYGGDQQLGAQIAEGEIDLLVFFWDPLTAEPHDPDVKALLRLAVLRDIGIACNTRTADLILPDLMRPAVSPAA